MMEKRRLATPALIIAGVIILGGAAVAASTEVKIVDADHAKQIAHVGAGGALQVTGAVTATDYGATQPYAYSLSIKVPDGSQFKTATFKVPAGKRLVVQSTGVLRGVDTSAVNSTAQVFIEPTEAKTGTVFPLPKVEAPTAGELVGTTLAAVYYADPASTVTVEVFRSGTSGGESDLVSFSGYLIDAS